MPFRFTQPEQKKEQAKIDPEKIDVDKPSEPSRYSLQRAAQRWKRDAPLKYRNLLHAKKQKEEK